MFIKYSPYILLASNIDNYIRYVYGRLKNKKELNFDTSMEGTHRVNLIFEDDFGNKVEKQFKLSVIGVRNEEELEIG